MKKIKMLIALLAVFLMLLVPAGCAVEEQATTSLGDKTLGTTSLGVGDDYDALNLKFYTDGHMRVVNITSDNAKYDEPVPAKMPDYEESTVYNRAGNDYVTIVEKLTIEKHVTHIGAYAFYDCDKLTELYIGPDVETIGENAFKNCKNLNSITVDPANKNFAVKDNCLIDLNNKTVIRANGNPSSVTLGSDITAIEDSAFYGCDNLTSIDMSATSITVLNEAVFKDCSALSDVKFSATLEAIDKSAFFRCTALESIDWDSFEKLTSIGDYAFYRCESLKEVKMPATLNEIGILAFSKCSSLETIVTASDPEGWNGSDEWLDIGGSAFYECNAIKNVYINSKLLFNVCGKNSTFGYLLANAYVCSDGDVVRNVNLFVDESFYDIETAGDYFKLKFDKLAVDMTSINVEPTVGEKFSLAGLKASLSYNDVSFSETLVLSELTVEFEDGVNESNITATAGDKVVTVKYFDEYFNTERVTSFIVEVKEPITDGGEGEAPVHTEGAPESEPASIILSPRFKEDGTATAYGKTYVVLRGQNEEL